MVEYFGQQLEGFCFTDHGWVQSYGSRCVKPPVLYGDVSGKQPMTASWLAYAQNLTRKPMKGMLTGPVTILCWSFVRDALEREEVCRQLALALRDEVLDLERAGLKIIQIDEAALREGLPLRKDEAEKYLQWAIGAFRLTVSGVEDLKTKGPASSGNRAVRYSARSNRHPRTSSGRTARIPPHFGSRTGIKQERGFQESPLFV